MHVDIYIYTYTYTFEWGIYIYIYMRVRHGSQQIREYSLNYVRLCVLQYGTPTSDWFACVSGRNPERVPNLRT